MELEPGEFAEIVTFADGRGYETPRREARSHADTVGIDLATIDEDFDMSSDGVAEEPGRPVEQRRRANSTRDSNRRLDDQAGGPRPYRRRPGLPAGTVPASGHDEHGQ